MDTPYEKLLAKLAGAEVKFIIVGGVAIALNGFVRTTEDVDILVEASPETSFDCSMNSEISVKVTPANSVWAILAIAKARSGSSKIFRWTCLQ